MDVGCSQWWSPASTMVPQYHLVQSYYSIFPKNHPPHLHRCYSVRVHPYAHPQIMKVLKHFIYLQYGCGMQFGTSCSLNHDTITSFGSTLPHLSKKFTPHHLHSWYSKIGPIGPTTAYECAQTLHIHPIWMWDAVSEGLQPQPWHHNVIWAPSHPNVAKLELAPPPWHNV